MEAVILNNASSGTSRRSEPLGSQTASIARNVFFACAVLAGLLIAAAPRRDFRFVIIGDRTGETVGNVYQRVLQAAAGEHPDFFINVGDTIQGDNDATVDAEWLDALKLLAPYRRIPTYFTPGNHDIWSQASKAAYTKYTGRPLQYSFDWQQAHFTVLDDHSLDPTGPIPEKELAFLTTDLHDHASQPLKFVFSHRPPWLLSALVRAQDAPLQKLAREYGVQFYIAGHLHQMLHFDVGGVTYLSVPSSGGHLRASKLYRDGWFFGYTVVDVHGRNVEMTIKELGPPDGESRVTHPNDWGGNGLVSAQ